MLTTASSISTDGVDVFRDDRDARTFYVPPYRAVLLPDEKGIPDLLLLRYVNPGGGLLTLRAALVVDEAHNQRILDGLRALLEREKKEGATPLGLPVTETEPVLATAPWKGASVSWRIVPAEAAADARHAGADATPGSQLDVALSTVLTLDAATGLIAALNEKRAPSVAVVLHYRISYETRGPAPASGSGDSARAIVLHEHVLDASVDLVLQSQEDLATCLRDVDLSDGFFDTMSVKVSSADVGFEREGIDLVHVFLEYSQPDESQRARPRVEHAQDFALKTGGDGFTWSFYLPKAAPAGRLMAYRYRVETFVRGMKRSRTPWKETTAQTLSLGLRELGIRRTEIVLVAKADAVQAAVVSLRAPDPDGVPAEDEVLLRPGGQHVWTRLLGEGSSTGYEYQVTYQTADGKSVKLPWVESDAEKLELKGPYSKTLEFEFDAKRALEPGDKIMLSVRYEDAKNSNYVTRSVMLDEATSSVLIAVPIMDGAPEEATWNAAVIRSGAVIEIPAARSKPGKVAIQLPPG